MTGARFREAMWSLSRCRTSEFHRFSSDPAIAYLATLARSRYSPSPALNRRKSLWGSTPALTYLTPTGQLHNKMLTDPVHRKSSPALLLTLQPTRRESVVWIRVVFDPLHIGVNLSKYWRGSAVRLCVIVGSGGLEVHQLELGLGQRCNRRKFHFWHFTVISWSLLIHQPWSHCKVVNLRRVVSDVQVTGLYTEGSLAGWAQRWNYCRG